MNNTLDKHLKKVKKYIAKQLGSEDHDPQLEYRLRYLCNSRLYYAFDYVDEDGNDQGLICGGYSDMSNGRDGVIVDLDETIGDIFEAMTDDLASEIIAATTRIDTQLAVNAKAAKRDSQYSIANLVGQVPTINQILDHLNLPEEIEPLVMSLVFQEKGGAFDANYEFDNIINSHSYSGKLSKSTTEDQRELAERFLAYIKTHQLECEYEADYDSSYNGNAMYSYIRDHIITRRRANQLYSARAALTVNLYRDSFNFLESCKYICIVFCYLAIKFKVEWPLGVIVSGKFTPLHVFMQQALVLLDKGTWSDNLFVEVEYDPDYYLDDTAICLPAPLFTSGLEVLGYKDITCFAEIGDEVSLNYWLKIVNTVVDTFINRGFITSPEPLEAVYTGTELIHLEERDDHLCITKIELLNKPLETS